MGRGGCSGALGGPQFSRKGHPTSLQQSANWVVSLNAAGEQGQWCLEGAARPLGISVQKGGSEPWGLPGILSPRPLCPTCHPLV